MINSLICICWTRDNNLLLCRNFFYSGGAVVWDLSFLRDLLDSEVVDFARLLEMLEKVYVSMDKSDVRLWKPDVEGQFSVKSFYNALVDTNLRVEGWKSFWYYVVPPRVLASCWVVKNHKILTIDKLPRRNHVIVNGCPMCLKDEEALHHLSIHCQFACRVWMVIVNMFEMKWVMPRTIAYLFIQW